MLRSKKHRLQEWLNIKQSEEDKKSKNRNWLKERYKHLERDSKKDEDKLEILKQRVLFDKSSPISQESLNLLFPAANESP